MVGGIVGAFKSMTTNEYIQKVERKNGHGSTNGCGCEIISSTSFAMRIRI